MSATASPRRRAHIHDGKSEERGIYGEASPAGGQGPGRGRHQDRAPAAAPAEEDGSELISAGIRQAPP